MPDADPSLPATVTERAPAKINLALHVTGQRADGYHLLETLVTFTDHGDRLEFSAADADGFTLSGRFSPLLTQETGVNLVLRARDLLRTALAANGHSTGPVHIRLDKALPVSSGIGGGSADAAATLRGLLRLWNVTLPDDVMHALAVDLGADVPMCLASIPLIARGIGEEIEVLPLLPRFALVLANPLISVSTPQVFRHLTSKANPPLRIAGATDTPAAWLATIAGLRNDLEPAATALVGEIAILSTMLARQGAMLVRMSGSGATCFGIFSDPAAAEKAAAALHSQRPDWYFQATQTLAGSRS